MSRVWKIVLIIALVSFVFGIAMMTVSALSGGSLERIRRNVSVTDYIEDFDNADINSLDIAVSAGRLKILRGDSFLVEARNISNEFFECRTENGTLIIRDKWTSSWSLNLSRGINFGSYEPSITLYVPEGFKAEDVFIDVSAGRCNIDGLSAKKAAFTVSAGELEAVDINAEYINVNMSAGRCRIDSLITQNGSIRVSAGELGINGIQTDECSLELTAGSAWVSGDIKKYGSFTCGVGAVSLELEGIVDDYNIEADVGLGSIYLDGERISGGALHKGSRANGITDIDLECGVGEIQVTFLGAATR